MDVITFPENRLTTSGLQILLHGVISLPDATSYDKWRFVGGPMINQSWMLAGLGVILQGVRTSIHKETYTHLWFYRGSPTLSPFLIRAWSSRCRWHTHPLTPYIFNNSFKKTNLWHEHPSKKKAKLCDVSSQQNSLKSLHGTCLIY